MSGKDRAQHEIEHGKWLASGDAETTWGWGSPAGQKRAEKRGAAIIAAGGLKPAVSALELGCGTGLFTQMFAATGAQITAIDISPELVEAAKKLNPNVKFIVGRFEDLPSAPQYDAIIGSSVLHHLELDEALKKSYQLLKPGGVMAFAEPNLLNPQVAAERSFLRERFFRYVSPDETAFVRGSIAKTLRSYGFTDVQIKPFDWLHPAIPKKMIGFVEGIGRTLESTPLLREFSGSLLIYCQKA
jgi:2-polyprenyl-3-methyl-5-hydroxy-6-metoxy-1,4-benzoquinol methylase